MEELFAQIVNAPPSPHTYTHHHLLLLLAVIILLSVIFRYV